MELTNFKIFQNRVVIVDIKGEFNAFVKGELIAVSDKFITLRNKAGNPRIVSIDEIASIKLDKSEVQNE